MITARDRLEVFVEGVMQHPRTVMFWTGMTPAQRVLVNTIIEFRFYPEEIKNGDTLQGVEEVAKGYLGLRSGICYCLERYLEKNPYSTVQDVIKAFNQKFIP